MPKRKPKLEADITDLKISPTPDGAGLNVELPTPPSLERLVWLGGELQKVVAHLDTLPQERPAEKAEGSPVYAAGLADMAKFILEKVQHDINYQGMRAFLGDAFPDLPKDSSSFSRPEPSK